MQNTNVWAKVAVMVRQDTTAGSVQGMSVVIPGEGVGSISCGITVSNDSTNPAQPTYTLTGRHKLFPPYEVYINNQLVHDYSPIPGNHNPSDLLLLPGFPVPSISGSSITAGTTKPLTGNITQ